MLVLEYNHENALSFDRELAIKGLQGNTQSLKVRLFQTVVKEV